MSLFETTAYGNQARRVLEAADAGVDVSVRGMRLSGRSSFLKHLQDTLLEQGTSSSLIRGEYSMRGIPLAHIAHLLPQGRGVRDATSFEAASRAMDDRLEKDGALLIDDIELLDEASRGLLRSAAARTNTPIISTTARSPLSGEVERAEPGLQVDLLPLGYEPFDRVIRRHLQRPIELDASARLFTKSGGLAGLGCRIVDAAVLTGRLVQNDAHAWGVADSLWDPSLSPVVGQLLVGLRPEDRRVLAQLAYLGTVDLDDALRFATPDGLERLEALGVVRAQRDSGQLRVSLFPPILADALGTELSALKKTRLIQETHQALDISCPESPALAFRWPDSQSDSASWTVDHALFREKRKRGALLAKMMWTATPSVSSAVPYVASLLSLHDPDENIEQVLGEAGKLVGTPTERARLAQIHAEWWALARGRVERANMILEEASDELPEIAPMLSATAIRLQTLTVGVPEDFSDRLELQESFLQDVNSELLETQVLVLLASGRIRDARTAMDQLAEGHVEDIASQAHELNGYLMLAEGRFSDALDWAENGFRKAAEGGQLDPLFRSGCLGLLASVFEGNYDRATQIGTQLLAVGEPSSVCPQLSLALRTLGVFVTVRTSRPEAALRFLKGIARIPFVRGPLFGQSAAIALAQMDAYDGDTDAAVERIWAEAEESARRGFLLVAMQQYLMAAEVDLSEQRLNIIREATKGTDIPFLIPYLSFLEAMLAQDAEALFVVASELSATGRPGHAATALQTVETLAQESKDAELEAAAADALRSLTRAQGGRRLDLNRLRTVAVVLTEREWEVAHLVAEGLPNPAIAARLVVSVRTVESHLTRIYRKIQSADRADIVAFVQRAMES